MSSVYIQEPPTSGKVCLKTTAGDIDIELWSKECPKACRNFVQLCMEGYYNGIIFHRLVKGFIIQGGDPTGTGMGGESIYGKPFKDELHSRLRFGRRGLLGMANGGSKDDNGSQFFFTLDACPDLQKKHTLFGKVVGPTLFNMLKMAESETDANERPLNPYTITGAEILNNPFDDIVPRKLEKFKEKKPKEKVQSQMKATKNYALLSFGDEAEEEELIVAKHSQERNVKSKSAHDMLAETDDKLSREPAVRLEEMTSTSHGLDDTEQQDEEMSKMRSKIREKLQKMKSGREEGEQREPDEQQDLQYIIETEDEQRNRQKVDSLKAELKSLQKDFFKSLKKPKPKEPEPEKVLSEGRKIYEDLRTKFLEDSKSIVKRKDVSRESQTMEMLSKFKDRLDKTSREAILFDRKSTNSDTVISAGNESEKMASNTDLADSTELKPLEPGKLDLDAEDMQGDEWMMHKFVAPEDNAGISKAKDANLKEGSEDWYSLDDPRNPINVRRRQQEQLPPTAKKSRPSS